MLEDDGEEDGFLVDLGVVLKQTHGDFVLVAVLVLQLARDDAVAQRREGLLAVLLLLSEVSDALVPLHDDLQEVVVAEVADELEGVEAFAISEVRWIVTLDQNLECRLPPSDDGDVECPVAVLVSREDVDACFGEKDHRLVMSVVGSNVKGVDPLLSFLVKIHSPVFQ